MTDSLLLQLCTVRYDHKPFEQIKSKILTCPVEQRHHQDLIEVQRTAAAERHKKYKLLETLPNSRMVVIGPYIICCLTRLSSKSDLEVARLKSYSL